MKCSKCGSDMVDMIFSSFCPNDCDREDVDYCDSYDSCGVVTLWDICKIAEDYYATSELATLDSGIVPDNGEGCWFFDNENFDGDEDWFVISASDVISDEGHGDIKVRAGAKILDSSRRKK